MADRGGGISIWTWKQEDLKTLKARDVMDVPSPTEAWEQDGSVGAQEPQSDIQAAVLWRLRATCVTDLFLRDVGSADRQNPGRRLMGTGYFIQAMGGCPTTFQKQSICSSCSSPDSRTVPCPLLGLHTAFFKL